MTKDELIEQLAEKEYASWARWMQYLFSKCDDWYEVDVHGKEIYSGKVIPLNLVEHWQRRIETGYQSLTDTEKQTCRNEAVHALPIVEKYIDEKLQNAVVKTIRRGGLVNPIGKHTLHGD